MAVSCPNCGNAKTFQVKTLQMHVIQVDPRVEPKDESRPAVFGVLCDECESELNFEEFPEETRREILSILGAR